MFLSTKTNLFYNSKQEKTFVKTKLILNTYKQKLAKKYKTRYFQNKKLNNTQKGLVQLELYYKNEEKILQQMLVDIIEFDILNEKCWDISKILNKYEVIKNQRIHF